MTPARPVKLLIVEDSEDDAELLVLELQRCGFAVTHRRVDTERALDEALAESWDLVISDFAMPQFDGLAAFAVVQRRCPDLPFVFVSGVLGEERAVQAMRMGAKDYLLKDGLDRLGPVVIRELDDADVRRRHAEMAGALTRERRRYESIFRSAAVALLEVDFSVVRGPAQALFVRGAERSSQAVHELLGEVAGGVRVLSANGAAIQLLDAGSEDELVGPLSRLMRAGSVAAWGAVLQAFASPDETFSKEVKLESLGGRELDVLLVLRVPTAPMDYQNVVVSMLDVSRRNDLERQMRAAQRMEAIGRLAGGVAHDFNNILTVITSYSGFLLDALPSGDPMCEDVHVIEQAAGRAAALTRQLLAFSRRQIAALQVLSINRVVNDMEKMLRRLIGEDVALVTELSPDEPLIEIDPGHLEQIVMNLAVNARDAMPDGGQLLVETAITELDARYAAGKPAAIPPGQYVMLAISDTGSGMDADTALHLFEPFFTTKAPGQGTGLGLSTVYGIVKQAGGYVWVYSEPSHGTTFKVYLPRKRAEGESLSLGPARLRASLRGTETVLVVEDDEHVRRVATRMLDLAGYRVLVAAMPSEALALCAHHDGPIHALITDVVMPLMNGRELADRLLALRPTLRVLFMSGYTSTAILHHGVLDEAGAFVEKPFTTQQLLTRLRDVLDGEPGSSAGH